MDDSKRTLGSEWVSEVGVRLDGWELSLVFFVCFEIFDNTRDERWTDFISWGFVCMYVCYYLFIFILAMC